MLTSLENKKVETIEKIDLGELVVNIKTYMEEMKKLIEDLSVESEVHISDKRSPFPASAV